jgi:hypothetical protein
MATGRVPTTANSPLTAKGDLFGYSTAPARLAAGTDEHRLVAASGETTGLKYVADTTNYVVGAKGDLLAGTAADTVAALAVGNNGETLVADSSTSTGLRYQVPVQQNPVLNSAMQVWQRGTSVSVNASTNGYTADRWYLRNSGNACTISQQATGDTTNLPNIQYCARVQRNSGQTAVNSISFNNSFETLNSIPFAGKTVTFSFYARVGDDFSGGTTEAILFTGTGTNQNRGVAAYTGDASPLTITMTSTISTTWQRFTGTATLATNITELSTYFYYTPSGTAGADDYFEVTGVQLEVGSVATPFKTYAATIQGELAACQRYYIRMTGSNYGIMGFANAYSTTRAIGLSPLPVTMRVSPTSVEYSTLAWSDFNNSYAVTALSLYTGTGNQMPTIDASVASGLTQNRFFTLGANNSSSGYLAFSAEL